MLGAAALLDLGVDQTGPPRPGAAALRRPPVVVRVGVPAVGFFLGLRVLGAEHVRHVVEHEPLALAVAQDPAVTADRLGDQDALDRRRPDHASRVQLHELHVQQAGPGQQGQRVPVPGVLPGVRGHLVGLADAPGGQHHGRSLEQHELAGAPDVAERARDLPGVQHQPGDRGLGEHLDHGLGVAVLDRVLLLQRDHPLLQGADDLQPGPVPDVGQPRVLVPAEVSALAFDLAVLGPESEQRAPGLQLPRPGPAPRLACSSAIRQLFRTLPPRMVSRKWTCQLSLGLALPMEAAQPPSAMTVCALPGTGTWR